LPHFRLNRRTVLRGVGSVAIALPWLEIMTPERTARAEPFPATRFVAVFTPGGTVLDKWRPTGGETSFALSPILQPLESVKERLLIVDGVDMASAVGDQDAAGSIAWLTGTPQIGSPTGFAGGPSIDQSLARQLSGGPLLNSLELGVRWGTGKTRGLPSPANIVNFDEHVHHQLADFRDCGVGLRVAKVLARRIEARERIVVRSIHELRWSALPQ